MALHYILDGYNIIKSLDALADLSLEQGRESLLKRINTARPQGSARNQVTVVFDGREDIWGAVTGARGQVKVIFSSGESADDCIKRMVEAAGKVKNIIVVTNDGGITSYVRRLGAKTMGVQDFLLPLSSSDKKSSGRGSRMQAKGGREKVVSQTAACRINREFEQIWLRKDHSKHA